jgi:hypothetical protein
MSADRLDARPTPIVVLPWTWPERLLPTLAGVGMVILVIALWYDPVMARRRGEPGADGWIAWVVTLMPAALMLAAVAAIAGWMFRAPGFAVCREGIKLGMLKRAAPGRSARDPWNYGFYTWDEVSHCEWAPYQRPGLLAVHVKAADQQALLGSWPRSMLRVPAMIYHRRVPARDREAVEAAIRSCGKWGGATGPA